MMSNYPIFERLIWFYKKVQQKKYPNASSLASYFELSVKTAQRNIDFMRDRVFAPLEYNASKRGYCYTDDGFELPRFPVTQEEILAVLISRKLLSYSAGGVISDTINQFIQKLFAVTGDFALTETRLDGAFFSVWTGYSPAGACIFRKIVEALFSNKILEFICASTATGKVTERRVKPYHLQHYMGSWVLLAWCGLRQAWRKFYLSRMDNVALLDAGFSPRPKDEWKGLVQGAFGIFQGNYNIKARLRFSPFRVA